MPSTKVLFIGDSVTDCGRREDADRQLGHGYVREVADRLALVRPAETVVNRGISGNRVVDLLERWTTDCIDEHPDTLSILIGINDTWRRYDSDDPTSVEKYERGHRSLLEQTVAAGIGRIILVDPFLLALTPEQAAWREDLDPKIAVVHALAAEFGARHLALDEFLQAQLGEYAAADLAADGVHPTELGHRIIADAWLSAYLSQ
jgi:lysophospholipase L1-like esterase